MMCAVGAIYIYFSYTHSYIEHSILCVSILGKPAVYTEVVTAEAPVVLLIFS